MFAEELSHNKVTERRRVQIQGVVQGVGFRPFVYTLATELGLSGFVGNDSSGLFIECEGTSSQLDTFIAQLQAAPPPLAHIDAISTASVSLVGESEFTIVESSPDALSATLISPDLSTCTECLDELFDPTNRRFHYPFINCTNCGPRFTITKNIPYDRTLTTMADFAMCVECQSEYDDPSNRRFHAQPNGCAECGPEVWWRVSSEQNLVNSEQNLVNSEAIAKVQQLIAEGGVVTVKGLGGFHLACDGTNDEAVQRLRGRKGRASKPFAIMVVDIKAAHAVAHINAEEEALLTSHQRPIVLLQKRTHSPISQSLSPGNNTIGIMLPYTPLHHLLFHPIPPSPYHPIALSPPHPLRYLVMTSANFSGQPIIKENNEALEKLSSIVDGFLLHNRDIHVHCDDSVVRVFRGAELPIRRSRGYAPFPVKLPFALQPTLAVGGELKSTFCLAEGHHAFLSQHIGDMENLETLTVFNQSVDHMQHIFRIEPELIACDLHPGYLSTRWAESATSVSVSGESVAGEPVIGGPVSRGTNFKVARLRQIQHHHTHIAAVMAEHGLAWDERVIGFVFDGTGYGTDGAIWGGEVLNAGYGDFERLAHLTYVPLPGGDAAIQKPYRMALAHLWGAGVEWQERLPPVAACSQTERSVLRQQLERQINTVETSSMGRLFDTVATLAGVRQTVSYEAQAAIELESLADLNAEGFYTFQLSKFSGAEAIDPSVTFSASPVIQSVVLDVERGVPAGVIAMRFHRAVANLIVDLALRIRDETGLNRVALSGGVFQNILLLELVTTQLEAHNLDVLTHRLVPPNDGGLALGQVVVANFS